MSDPIHDLVSQLNKAEKRLLSIKLNVDEQCSEPLKVYLKAVLKSSSIKNANETDGITMHLKNEAFKYVLFFLQQHFSKHDLNIRLMDMLAHVRLLISKCLYKHARILLKQVIELAEKSCNTSVGVLSLDLEQELILLHVNEGIDKQLQQVKEKLYRVRLEKEEESQYIEMNTLLLTHYVNIGNARNEQDLIKLEGLKAHYPKSSTWLNRIYYAQSMVLYHHLSCDLVKAYRYARQWVEIFHHDANRIHYFPHLYLKGMHYYLSALYHLNFLSQFKEQLRLMMAATEKFDMGMHRQWLFLHTQYCLHARLNLLFLSGDFSGFAELKKDFNLFLHQYDNEIDKHRSMTFHFKFASAYFILGNYDKAIQHLSAIISGRKLDLRSDIQIYARILDLVVHYDAGYDADLPYKIKRLYLVLKRLNQEHGIHIELIRFFDQMVQLSPFEITSGFRELFMRLQELSSDPYQKRVLMYLDIPLWLESKLKDVALLPLLQSKTSGYR